MQVSLPGLGSVTFRRRGVSCLEFYPALYGKLIRGDQTPVSVPMFGRKAGRELDLGRISEHYSLADVVDESERGVLLSRRVVTNAGVAYLATEWFNNSVTISNFNAHGNGTGTNAEAVTDTALQIEVMTRSAGTKSNPAANQVQSQATINQTATNAITEQGLFNSTTVVGSTLWDRSVFSAINVVTGDAIQFTYVLTINAGG